MKPPCQLCRSSKNVIAQGCSGEVFWCKKCSALVDTDPDVYVGAPHNNPAISAEINEKRRLKK